MKKTFFLLVLLVIVNISMVEGQTRFLRRPPSKFGYGLKGGLNLAWQSSPGNKANVVVKDIIGFNAGGYCNYFLYRQIAVQAELLASIRGSHWKDFYNDMRDNVTYLDLPLLFKYQPHRYINLQAGPVLSARINATQKDLEAKVKSDITDYYKPFEFAVTAGAEVTFPAKINATVRFVYGLTPATTQVEYVDPWYNSAIVVSVGYRFAGR